MKMFLRHYDRDQTVVIRANWFFPDGKGRGLFREVIRPGESYMGWTYEELVAMGNGERELQPKEGPNAAPGG